MNTHIVRRARILGTNIVTYRAWELANYSQTHTEFSSTMPDQTYGCLGLVTSRNLPTNIANMPRGTERNHAVGAYLNALVREALQAIETAFPDCYNSEYATVEGDIESYSPGKQYQNETRVITI